MTIVRTTFAVAVVLLLGCRSAAPPDNTALQMQRTELFFGLSIPGREQVSEQDWQQFVDQAVTPRFPDGFTVIDGSGQWRQSSGQISHEPAKILLLIHRNDSASIQKLDEIRSEYKRRFKQEAVIRESEEVKVSF
jgi:hypothetical protein